MRYRYSTFLGPYSKRKSLAREEISFVWQSVSPYSLTTNQSTTLYEYLLLPRSKTNELLLKPEDLFLGESDFYKELAEGIRKENFLKLFYKVF